MYGFTAPAAAAESLEDQSRTLVRAVSMFRLKAEGGQVFETTPAIRDNVARLPERTSRPAAPRSVAAVPKVRRTAAGSVANDIDDEWEEF